jgi:acetyl-CoA C-acetyltransferase
VLNAPMIAEPLGLFDCCGVSDGAACAIVTTPEIARASARPTSWRSRRCSSRCPTAESVQFNSWDGSYFAHHPHRREAKAYKEAGITETRASRSQLFEVHDCFSITELVTMEDLQLSAEGGAKDVLDGFYDADGKMPCQIDGGLKCFGHPIGASGLRMLYEMYLQLQGRAGPRQLADPKIGMTHNLGGAIAPSRCRRPS